MRIIVIGDDSFMMSERNPMRILFFMTLLAQVLCLSTARAGDVAELEILGFTKDGGVFAFEEYGIQDGSGFPYANRFYIDTTTDKFLPGTPIRVRLDDESASLDTARNQAREKGEAIVAQAELNRGIMAGFNPVTELSADPFRMVVNPRPIFYPVDSPLEFRLDEIAMNNLPGMEVCNSQGEIKGFRLLRIEAVDGGQTRLLHEDKSIPQSRGCPHGYAIGGVQTFAMDGLSTFAVLISVRQHGFEGPDHRWIAVTGRL
jgi:predicted secreted protein